MTALIPSFQVLDLLIYVALSALAVLQITLLLRKKSLPKSRLWLRLGLNALLWIAVVLFVIQPQWTFSGNTRRVLLISENIPNATVQKAKDSLKITETFSMVDFAQRTAEDPDFTSRMGVIYLLGQEADPRLLSQLSQKEVHWLPVFKANTWRDIRWKGMLRKGELQEVTGTVELTEPAVLKITYGRQVLDSISLAKGLQTFRLRFPAFAIGRTETTLESGSELRQKVSFYSRNPPPLSVYFVLENPDFESKTLAEWLGKNGSRVEMLTTVAKSTQSKVEINRAARSNNDAPDLVITDPSNANHPLVKKAVADGKSVLFFNVTAPEPALKTINNALGTQWRAKKISNEESIALGSGITALPYQLEAKLNQKNIAGYPAAVQKIGAKVGVSLLNETFSLKLSGDSLTYGRIWSEILQPLRPAFSGNIAVEAPLWKDTRARFVLNQFPQRESTMSLARDTAYLQTSGLNPATSMAHYIFRRSGWQPFQDSLEVYVEEEESELAKATQLRETLQARQADTIVSTVGENQALTAQVPDWLWFILILVCLTALWVEPKLER